MAKSDRSCTDVVMLIIFVLFTGGMVFVSGWAFWNGNAYMLLYGTDSWGNVCSRPAPSSPNQAIVNLVPLYGSDMTNLSKVFYFDFLNYESSVHICVAACPKLNATVPYMTSWQIRNYAQESGIQVCRYDVALTDYTVNDETLCPSRLDDHKTVLNRCVPETAIASGLIFVQTVGNTLSGALSALEATCSIKGNFFDMASSDIEKTWKEILYLSAVGLGAAVVMTLLLRFVAFIAIWLIVIMSGLGMLAAACYCWYRWFLFHQAVTEIRNNPNATVSTVLQERVDSWMNYGIISSIIALITLLILLVMWKRIALVAQLFKEAGKALAAVPSLMIQPFLTMVVLVITLAGLVITGIFMITTDYPAATDDGYVEWKTNQLFEYVRWPYLLGALWHVQFVFACHQLVIAGAIGKWYFTRDKKKNLGSPLCHSISNLCRYHMGSAAFGSLIVAIVQLIRAYFAFIQKRLASGNNKLAQYALKGVQCCLWCIEKIIKFINMNAYIMVAIKGKNFCSGAKAAFFLLLENVLRVAAVNSVGSFCLFLVKLGITAGVFVIGMNFFQSREDICYTWLPNLVGAMFALCISHVYLSLYAMCIDTLLLCFCMDCEENDGVDSPFYMSKSLMTFMNNKVKKKTQASITNVRLQDMENTVKA